MTFATSSWAQTDTAQVCFTVSEAREMARDKEKQDEKVITLEKEYKRLETKYELTDSLRILYRDNYYDQIDITDLEIKNGKKKGRRGWLIGALVGSAGGLVGGLLLSR